MNVNSVATTTGVVPTKPTRHRCAGPSTPHDAHTAHKAGWASPAPWRLLAGYSIGLMLMFQPAGPAHADNPLEALAPMSVTAQRGNNGGDAIEVDARAEVDATLEVIWNTLTDYNRLHEFIPGMQSSKLIERRGNAVIVEQKGESKVAFFTFPIDVVIASIELPPHRINVRIEKGNLRRLDGGYIIAPVPGKGRLRHILTWNGMIEPDAFVPPLLGTLVMRGNIEDQFGGMVREIMRRQAESTSRATERAAENKQP